MPDTDAIVDAAIRRQSQMESQRSIFESHWKEVAEIVLPRQDVFWRRGGSQFTGGEKRTQRQFDSTAELALGRFSAAMISMLVPRTQEWHKLVPEDPDIQDDQET